MSLIGTYQNNSTGETLQITNTNSGLGTFTGLLQLGNFSMPIEGEYHLFNGTKLPLILTFSAINYLGTREVWAGLSFTYQDLNVLGVHATLSESGSSVSFRGGPFMRV